MILSDSSDLLSAVRDQSQRFRSEIDGVMVARIDSEVSEKIEQAMQATINTQHTLLASDDELRRRFILGSITDSEYRAQDAAIVYFSKVWLATAKYFAEAIHREHLALAPQLRAHFENCIKEMVALLEDRKATVRTMTPELVAMQEEALKEHRDGKTEQFLSFEE